MICRCGHQRHAHQRPRASAYGHRQTFPCQARTPEGLRMRQVGKRIGGICKCRDFTLPQKEAKS